MLLKANADAIYEHNNKKRTLNLFVHKKNVAWHK